MAQTQTQIRKARRDRDAELRAAHQAAFAKMAGAVTGAERRRSMAAAVQDLLDACEEYLSN